MPGQRIVINDTNYHQFCGPYKHDGQFVARGFLGTRHRMYRPRRSTATWEDLGIPLIPESEWDDRAREQEQKGETLEEFINNMKLPCKDQNGYPFCWAYAVTGAAEVDILQQYFQIMDLCTESLVARITGFQKRGGWGSEAVEGMGRYGCNTTDEWPHLAYERSRDNATSQAQAKKRLLLDYVVLGNARDPDVRAKANSCLLSGKAIAGGHDWWLHEIYHCGLRPRTGGEQHNAHRIRNSWKASWGENGFGWLEGTRQLATEFCVPFTVMPS